MTKNRIRVIALGLIQQNHRVFVSQGFDPTKQQTFYRALGGGVEFGETSLDALKREFWEEIQADLANIHYLGCIENVFVYDGKPGHEIIQLYRCDFADPAFYELQSMTFSEGDRSHLALWVDIQRIQSGELILYPTQCLQYL
jgi:8-oxo-dGTP pyrophosphatase MutT (NUDIX family)